MSELKFKHGIKSYDIVEKLISHVYPAEMLTILDLTYGVGRFYRKLKHRVRRLIAVDRRRYVWETVPDEFYEEDAKIFAEKILRGEIKITRPDLIVIDPPWSQTKRGYIPRLSGIADMPYHIRGVDINSIINAAITLSRHYNSPVLYRFKNKLPYRHLIHAEAEVKIMGKTGIVHYGICKP